MEFLKHYFKNIQFLSLSLSLFLYIHKNSNKKWRNFCFDGKEFEIIQFACVDFSFVFLHSVVFTRAESTPESFHVLCISISLFQSKLKQPNHPKSSQIIPNHPKSSIRLCTNQSTPGLNLFRWDFPDNADDGPEMALPVAAPSTWFTDSVSFDGVSLLRVPPDILTLIYLFIYIFMYVAIELMIGAVLMKWANSWKWVGWGQTSAFMRYWHGPA